MLTRFKLCSTPSKSQKKAEVVCDKIDVPTHGCYVYVKIPGNILLGFWQDAEEAKKAAPPQVQESNCLTDTISYVELVTSDLEATKSFCASEFKWELTEPIPGLYAMYKAPKGKFVDVGIRLKEEKEPTGTISYVTVDSIATFLPKCEKAGAKQMMGKTPVPGRGWFAYIATPGEIVQGLWEEDHNAPQPQNTSAGQKRKEPETPSTDLEPETKKKKESGSSSEYTVTIDAPIAKVYQALTTKKGLCGWWTAHTELRGKQLKLSFNQKPDGTFGEFCQFGVSKALKNKAVEWKCSKSDFHVKPPAESEWVNTRVRFDLTKDDKRTTVHFVHQGLHDALECYDSCNSTWGELITKYLKNYVESGEPNPKFK